MLLRRAGQLCTRNNLCFVKTAFVRTAWRARRCSHAAMSALPTPVWIDCDPGHDDAIALVLAAHSPRLRLLGVSTVAGNQTLERVTANALRVLYAAGVSGVDVVPGAAKPLLRPAIVCEEIHGGSGLDGHAADLPQPTQRASADSAVLRMRAVLEEHPTCVLLCLGALTNVALLVSLFPSLAPSLRIVLMGGCVGAGNTGAVAEFNIQIDPHAASIVFNSGADVTLVPLEVTHTALATAAVMASVREGGSPFRLFLADLLVFFRDTYKRVFGFDDPPLHDPCAVAYVIDPSLFVVKHMRVDVECSSELCMGQTVVDVWGSSGKARNVLVATSMDVHAFWALVLAAIAAADGASPLNQPRAV